MERARRLSEITGYGSYLQDMVEAGGRKRDSGGHESKSPLGTARSDQSESDKQATDLGNCRTLVLKEDCHDNGKAKHGGEHINTMKQKADVNMPDLRAKDIHQVVNLNKLVREAKETFMRKRSNAQKVTVGVGTEAERGEDEATGAVGEPAAKVGVDAVASCGTVHIDNRTTTRDDDEGPMASTTDELVEQDCVGLLSVCDQLQDNIDADTAVERLMYYLRCVYAVLQPAQLAPYISIGRHRSTTAEECQDEVLALAAIFNPQDLLGSIFFHSEDCGISGHLFYDVRDIHAKLPTLPRTCFIGGKKQRVEHIMFFSRRWIHSHYVLPMQGMKGRLADMVLAVTDAAKSNHHVDPTENQSSVCHIL